MTLKDVQKTADLANKILVVNEMIKQISAEEIEPWDPVNIIVAAVGNDNLQYCLFNYLNKLKQELKEDIVKL